MGLRETCIVPVMCVLFIILRIQRTSQALMEGECQTKGETPVVVSYAESHGSERGIENSDKDQGDAWMGMKAAQNDDVKVLHLKDSNLTGNVITSSVFYATSGKRKFIAPALEPGKTRRKVLLSIASDEKYQWRKFHSQSEAFVYCDERPGRGLRTWALEIDNKGRRRFIAATVQAFWRNYSRLLRRNAHVHFYEVIREHHAAKLYLDLEFLREYNPSADCDAMTHAIVTTCLKEAGRAMGSEPVASHEINEEKDGIMVLESTTEKKFSRHVVFTGIAFHDNVQMGHFVRNVVDRVSREDPKMVLVHSDDGRQVPFVDLGVYTRNRCFRLIGSSKFGKTTRLLLSGVATDRIRVSFLDFSRSLVCSVSNDKFLLGSPERTDNLHGIGGRNRIRDSIRTNYDTTAIASRKAGPVQEFQSRENPLSRTLDEYVMSIVEPYGGGIYGVTTMCEGDMVTYVIKGGYKFCANIGRHHKSNNVILVADFQNRCMFQRCFDPDCRTFRSQPWPLPPSVLQRYEPDIDDQALITMMDEIDASAGYDGGVSDTLLLQAADSVP